MAAADLDRRAFLKATGAVATLALAPNAPARADSAAIPIVDAHIHLFDATRPQGAPYQGPDAFTSHKSLPHDYARLAAPLGIVAAVVVEASPWVEDNLWVLEVAQSSDMMVATVGSLQPEKPEFAEYLERYHRNPLYRGIRVNNTARSPMLQLVADPAFIGGLKRLAQADLVLDTANPSLDLLRAVVRINDQVPDLRVIVDHLPALDPTPAEGSDYAAVLAEIHGRPNIYVKLSEILHRVDGRVATDLASHRERLDYLLTVFGEDRVLFGSDYPNSVGTASFGEVVSLAKQYFATQPRVVAEKYFWKNSLRCYKWVKRAAGQPELA